MMDPEIIAGAKFCAPETDESARKVAANDVRAARGTRKSRHENLSGELPPPGVTRWVIRRKAQVVAAVLSGAITLDEVWERYSVSNEEFTSWQRSLERHGVYGLRTTRVQLYREAAESAPKKSR